MPTERTTARAVAALAALAVLLTACGEVVTLSERRLELELRPEVDASTIVDADGNRLAVLQREYRERIGVEELPAVLVDAVLAAEDQRFWEHDGVDARALTRAALRNAVAGEVVEGGSTITQQLVELRFMAPAEDTLETKATEAALALEVERQFPKEWILEEYLNTVYLGGGAYGVGAAAWSYFRADVDELTLPQAALLAGLIRTPGTADPRVSLDAATARRDTVIGLMRDRGGITAEQATAAAAAPVVVHPAPSIPDRREPHVVDLAIRQLLGEPALGSDEARRWQRLTGAGLTIHTTIDPAAQESARSALVDELDDEGDPDGAVVTIDNRTGRLLAITGSLPYDELQFDLPADGVRQPGSVVKGVTTVAALVAGVRPDTELDARGGRMPTDDGELDSPWYVRGSGRSTRTLADALRWSDNSTFARLGLDLGVPTVAGTARGLGMRHDLGLEPAVLLGGTSTCCTTLDVATAYATIGSLGVHRRPTIVSHITDEDGDVVWRASTTGRQAVDTVVAWEAAELLTGVVTDGTGRAAAVSGHVVAGKTGTTTDNTDGWFVGTTPSLTTAVWVGHHDGRRTALVDGRRVTGGGPPAAIFRTHMRRVLGPGGDAGFVLPDDRLVTVEVDVATGLRVSEWCGETEPRTFPDSRVPTEACPSPAPPPSPPPPPSPRPSASPDPSMSPGPSVSPTPGDGGSPSGSPDPSDQDDATPTPTAPPTAPPTPSVSPSPSPSPSQSPPATPSPSPTPTPSQSAGRTD